jgi:hypothetical protein
VIRTATLVKYLGLAWLWIGGAFIVLSAASTLYQSGVRRMLQLWSPFNETNFALILLIMAPGIALLYWSEKLSERQR